MLNQLFALICDWKGVWKKSREEKGRMNASLDLMEVVHSLWTDAQLSIDNRTIDLTVIVEVPTYEFWRLHRVSAGGNETWFTTASPAPMGGERSLPDQQQARSWRCSSNSSVGLGREALPPGLSQLCLVCWQTSRFLRSALKITISSHLRVAW